MILRLLHARLRSSSPSRFLLPRVRSTSEISLSPASALLAHHHCFTALDQLYESRFSPLRSLATSTIGLSSAESTSKAMAGARPGEEEELVTAEVKGHAAVITLNRSKALNSLNLPMVKLLQGFYERFEKDKSVDFILLKGSGRAFCAGGDVRMMYELGRAGNFAESREFFSEEYKLNYFLATLEKPHVAILNGIVMGGGTGISIHGMFRVVTENTVFAMPETAIALHPDVGASHYLSRLPGYIGEYLGLTGARLNGADMCELSLATHFVPSDLLPHLEERLAVLSSLDEAASSIDCALLECSHVPLSSDDCPTSRQELIDKCFGKPTVEDIVQELRNQVAKGEIWCRKPLAAMAKASPTSLKVTLRSIRDARGLTLAQNLQKEYRLTSRLVEGTTTKDLYEGVRAQVIDKTGNPSWEPSSLEGVTRQMVDAHFASLPMDEELLLPVMEREKEAEEDQQQDAGGRQRGRSSSRQLRHSRL